jgi:GT2 family glycosyltransferase
VLNYNGGALVERCIDHLEALDWPAERLDLVVVDNASVDGSDERLAERPRVRLVRSPRNAGFPANNLGLVDLTGVDYVGLVNNDAFVDPHFLQPLVDALEQDAGLGAACPKMVLEPRFAPLSIASPAWRAPGDPRSLGVRVSGVETSGADRWKAAVPLGGFHSMEAGEAPEVAFRWTSGAATLAVPADDADTVVRVRLSSPEPVLVTLDGGAGPVEVTADRRAEWFEVPIGRDRHDIVQNAGSRLVRGGYGGDRGFLEPDRGQYDEPQEVFAWCGGAVLLRPEYLEDVGLLDDRFFLYYEDTDLSWRGRLRGWRYRYVPTSRVRHVHSATAVEGSALFNHFVQRNRLAMLTKCAPAGMVLRALASYLLEMFRIAWHDGFQRLRRGRRPSFGLLAGRVRSLGAYLRLLPVLLADRRRIRRGRSVADAAIVGWAE